MILYRVTPGDAIQLIAIGVMMLGLVFITIGILTLLGL